MYYPILGLLETQTKYQINRHQYIGGWEKDNTVYLWYRDEKNPEKRVVVSVPDVPKYYCLSKEDFRKLPKDLIDAWKKSYFQRGAIVGNYAYFYQTKPIYRQDFYNFLSTSEDDWGIRWLEADITRLNRVMIDLDLKVANPDQVRTAFFDIETDDRGEKPNPGVDRIISIVWKDGWTGEEHFLKLENDTDEAEKAFLQKVMVELIEYDVLIGYNNYSFDDVCLKGRFTYYDINMDKWRRIATLDMYNLMERQGTFRKLGIPNKKLDTIAQKLLGRGKVKHDEGTYEMWATKPDLLELYNYEDVRLIYEMEKILGTARLVLSVSSTAGLLHSIGYSPAKTVDTFLLRKAARNRQSGKFDFRYPTQYYRPEHNLGHGGAFSRNALPSDKRKSRASELEEFGIEYEPVEGALVLDSQPGLYKNVHFCDFKSLYPNTIRAFNIGLDTLVDEDSPYPKCQSPNNYTEFANKKAFYRTDITSGMAESVEELLMMRANIRAEMKKVDDPMIKQAMDIQQNGVKELTNSFYGVTAQYGGRHFNKLVAESITGSGRLFLPFGVKVVESLGHKVALGDTDSLAISLQFEDDIDKVKNTFIQQLRRLLKDEYQAVRPEVLDMAIEKKADRLLIVAKKLYAIMITAKDGKPCEPELGIKGLGLVKGNFPKWAANICKSVLMDILSGDKSADYFIRFLEKEKGLLINNKIPLNQLLISARLGKELDEYKGENPLVHVRIARRLKENGKLINAYSTITYLVTEGNDKHIEGVDESEIIYGETKYDAAYLWNTFIMQQAGKYLEIAFPEIDWAGYRFPRNLKRTPFQLKLLAMDKNYEKI